MNFQNVYPPCTNMKAPSGRLSGDGSSQGRRHGGAFGSSYPQTFFVPPKILFSSKKYVQPFGSRVYPLFCRTLQSYNSPGDWARELSKPSTDSASLVVKIEKKNVFRFRWGDFWRWRHKEGMFWKFWPPLAGPGPQPIDPFFWLKVLLKTRLKSASIEPWIDLLGYRQPKSWVNNLVFGLIQNFAGNSKLFGLIQNFSKKA